MGRITGNSGKGYGIAWGGRGVGLGGGGERYCGTRPAPDKAFGTFKKPAKHLSTLCKEEEAGVQMSPHPKQQGLNLTPSQ
jgi:hypothetical protein